MRVIQSFRFLINSATFALVDLGAPLSVFEMSASENGDPPCVGSTGCKTTGYPGPIDLLPIANALLSRLVGQ